MSEATVDLVRRLYAGPSMVEGPAHPDVEFDATAGYPDQPVVSAAAHEFTIRDSLVVRVKVYRDRGEALAACGIDPS